MGDSLGWCAGQGAVDLAGDESLEAAHDVLFLGSPSLVRRSTQARVRCRSACGPGRGCAGFVGVPVAAAVEAVAVCAAGGRGVGCDAGQVRERASPSRPPPTGSRPTHPADPVETQARRGRLAVLDHRPDPGHPARHPGQARDESLASRPTTVRGNRPSVWATTRARLPRFPPPHGARFRRPPVVHTVAECAALQQLDDDLVRRWWHARVAATPAQSCEASSVVCHSMGSVVEDGPLSA